MKPTDSCKHYFTVQRLAFKESCTTLNLIHTLNGIREIFLVAFLGDLSNFWLFALTGDNEYDANEEVSAPGPLLFLLGEVY